MIVVENVRGDDTTRTRMDEADFITACNEEGIYRSLSHEALAALYDYLDELADEIVFDVEFITGDFVEYTREDLMDEYAPEGETEDYDAAEADEAARYRLAFENAKAGGTAIETDADTVIVSPTNW